MFDLSGKKMIINCDICDTRTMSVEAYDKYEQIIINADLLIVNSKSKELFNSLPTICNVDETIEVEDDRKFNFITSNGNYEIKPNMQVDDNTILVVNGCLKINPDAEDVLKNYYKICVNGVVKCPKSLEGCMKSLSLNGSIDFYPDDCIMLDEYFTLDKYFPIRAKNNGKYHAANTVILSDEDVDVNKLIEKNIQFSTKTFITTETMLEKSIVLFDETVKLIVSPSDCKLICENVILDQTLFEKYGSNMFIYGNLVINEDSSSVIKKIEKLIVKGCIYIKKQFVEDLKNIDVEYDALSIESGRKIENKPSVTLDNTLFTHSPDGIHVLNTANVNIKDDISPDTILNSLKIENCAMVFCNEEQKSAIDAVSINVATVLTDKAESGIQGGINLLKTLFNNKIVNADNYIM